MKHDWDMIGEQAHLLGSAVHGSLEARRIYCACIMCEKKQAGHDTCVELTFAVDSKHKCS